ncbi:MAG: asparagine synthase (glutamine-hydrolyzing) [Legionella sp.]
MCGLTGFLYQKTLPSNAEQLLKTMTSTLKHRGPDDNGIWLDNEAGIGLGHARLAVVDLTSAGHQPMSSANGRYVLVFNGEIYNHWQLRKQLTHVTWRGNSDTETLLAGFEAWGIEETVVKTVGMFAFALWDKQNRLLVLGRDRAGEKPLYYGWQGTVFMFGSELKALKIHPEFKKELHGAALSLYLKRSYIPAPHSIYKNIYKLMPGTLLYLSLSRPEPVVHTYWSAANRAIAKANDPFIGDDEELINELKRLMNDAISLQKIADVPLGAFLSGGIDSSLIVALMQAQSRQRVKTFSIGFDDAEYNEAHHAKMIAKHLNTDHTELYIKTDEALKVIPKLAGLYDEPFADSSQIPTFLVSEMAKQYVTVALTGDAGDELFCGYNRYVFSNKLWRQISKIPMPLRKVTSSLIKRIDPSIWDKTLSRFPLINKTNYLGHKLHKGADVLTCTNINDAYNLLISQDVHACALLPSDYEDPIDALQIKLLNLRPLDRLMVIDFMTYLPDDILVKVDRASMGVSLETRLPFLDHRIIEFAWSLPAHRKLHNNISKWPLKQLLYRHVPAQLVNRSKMGFAIPLNNWLRGPLKEWAHDLLNEKDLMEQGLLDANTIQAMWQAHLSGQNRFSSLLWTILMFQAWSKS